jgi:hypothetical protein
MKSKLFSATIFYPIERGLRPRKYRNIGNKTRFIEFAQKSGGKYINFYNMETKEYQFRVYLQNS